MNNTGAVVWGAVGILAVLIVGTVVYYSFANSSATQSSTPITGQYEITAADTGKTFSYPETSRFTVILDSTKYAASSLACNPSGILGSVSNAPAVSAPNFAARFEAVAPGTCELTDGNFRAIIIVTTLPDGGTTASSTAGGGGVMCTADAKQCPDGTWVGRTGPNCQFVCPGTNPGIAPYTSGVRGTVMLGPTCPVERMPPDPNCADKPYSTTINIYRASDHTRLFASVASDAEGKYAASLPPGDYYLTAGKDTMTPPRCTPVSATVGPSGYTTANISCDSGIR